MNDLTILEGIYGIATLALGMLVAVLRDAIKDLFRRHGELDERVNKNASEINARVSRVREDLARDYVPRAEMRDSLDNISKTLNRIEEKLNGKVDK